ncbi:hypothetical protein MF271_00945 (plasmid) [Deinococcus sp. KNUC1210]|uniref:hypothetical protein n=1 Tax=Deinococcus sp. KNUC1210 TaxID=2917691 RepID=UPI001EF0699D|nr:hypothetical protein [Deinococcus sp. KNUC1210]ULH13929.1 hypothetical protein MF271_00945 [Deinococcus sp. KNUC1210]
MRHKQAFQRGHWQEARRPAAEWRPMPFGRWLDIPGLPPTPLRQACGGADEGSGSTWAALQRRGFVQVCDRTIEGRGYSLPHVTLSIRGRKFARELAGTPVERRAPGVLAQSTWKALAAAWNAGETGLIDTGGGWHGGIGWDTWLVLRNRTSGGDLTESVRRLEKYPKMRTERWVYYLRLSDAGRTYYMQRWEANSAAYPEIDAPNPITVLMPSILLPGKTRLR